MSPTRIISDPAALERLQQADAQLSAAAATVSATEAELAEIVAFLERPVGKHFLDGRWRMEAYTGTNTEEMEEQIVKEAMASLAK